MQELLFKERKWIFLCLCRVNKDELMNKWIKKEYMNNIEIKRNYKEVQRLDHNTTVIRGASGIYLGKVGGLNSVINGAQFEVYEEEEDKKKKHLYSNLKWIYLALSLLCFWCTKEEFGSPLSVMFLVGRGRIW